MNWFEDPSHLRWLDAEGSRLLDFARASAHPKGGFGWLDAHGRLHEAAGVPLWITCRMTHCFALGQLKGDTSLASLVDRGVVALMDVLRDSENDGWFHSLGGPEPDATGKHNYAHAFVILASASATAAGHPDGQALLDHAVTVHSRHFWDQGKGLTKENFARDWSQEERYRGVNSAMHTVEAYLAAADVLGDQGLLDRALSITDAVVNGFARANGWLLPEHFTRSWEPVLDYNADRPADPFRPYGVTIGHLLEWSRLVLQVEATLIEAGREAPPWALPAAVALYDEAVGSGWAVDGAEGFIYTMDFERVPVVRERMHWVAAEAIGAAAALHRRTGLERYAQDYATWWTYVRRHLIDDVDGSWHHELSPSNGPSATVWSGKPDIYHGYQATLLPVLPLAPALAPALARLASAKDVTPTA